MERKLWGLFSGAQLTIMFTALIAVLLPGTLWAVNAYSNVAIENPNNGQKALIDNFRRLAVTDAYLEQSAIPANLVHFFSGGVTSNCKVIYTVPAGKALILQSLVFYNFQDTSAPPEQDVFSDSSCGTLIAAGISDTSAATVVETFGSGFPIPAGHVIASYRAAGYGSFHGSGYLVPAGQVPQTAAATASVQPTPGQSPTRMR